MHSILFKVLREDKESPAISDIITCLTIIHMNESEINDALMKKLAVKRACTL